MLQSLTEMKEKIDSGKQLQNNMWCHFGKVVIDSMDEGSFVRLVGCFFFFLTCTASVKWKVMVLNQESELCAKGGTQMSVINLFIFFLTWT